MSENPVVDTFRRPHAAIVWTVRMIGASRTGVLLFASVLGAGVLLGERLDQGWWPHDDGSLAHSAERVLAGELPHRDVAEIYTGLLSFVNAGVFAIAGEDMFNLRLPLYGLFLAYAACFFSISRRFVSAIWAFAATLFAITWAVPVYPVPIASWYLLFFSTFGIYAVLRFFETDRSYWLFVAGAFGGIAILIKVVGVWYVVAVALALLAAPLLDAAGKQRSDRRSRNDARLASVSALFAFVLAAAVISKRPGGGEVVGLLVPIAAVCGAVAILGRKAWAETDQGFARATYRGLAVFLAGVGVPLALFAVPYALSGSLDDLFQGVFIAPQSRFEFASWSMPPPATLLRAAPVVAIFLLRPRVSERSRRLLDVCAGALMLFLVLTARDDLSYSIIWDTTRALAPFIILFGALAILRGGRNGVLLDPRPIALVVLVAGFSTLTQFPFATPLYFCYVAPFILLAAIAALRSTGYAHGLFPAVVLVALVVFGLRQLDNQSILSLGVEYKVDPHVSVLDSDRASIRIQPEMKDNYDRVRRLVAEHRLANDAIFAGPDTPELYFLTESRNLTPAILDFLDDSNTTRGNQLIRLLRKNHVEVVVLNHVPDQSPSLAPATVEQIRSMYNKGERVGRFEVRWSLST